MGVCVLKASWKMEITNVSYIHELFRLYIFGVRVGQELRLFETDRSLVSDRRVLPV